MSACQPPAGTAPNLLEGAPARQLDPVHGISVMRPGNWRLQDAWEARYGDATGHMIVGDWPGDATDVDHAAQDLARQFPFPGADVAGAVLDGDVAVRFVTPRWPGFRDAYALVAYPAPIKRTFAERTASGLLVEADRAHLDAIARSIRFERRPVDYLDGMLGLMQDYSFKRARIDWPALRARATAAAQPLATLRDAQRGVGAAIDVLADRHSMILAPRDSETFFSPRATGVGYGAERTEDGQLTVVRIYAGSPAERAGLKVGDRVVGVERREGGETVRYLRPGTPSEQAADLVAANYSTALQPTYKLIRPGVGYLELPDTVAGDNYDPYRRALAAAIAKGDAEGARAWIVDVRRNSGGNHWAMIAPLGSIIGEGAFGGIENADGSRSIYRVVGGRVQEDDSPIDPDLVPPVLSRPAPPVAVLQGPLSASAAEAVVLAFVDRPGARRFGGPTLGVPTGNTAFELWDGAFVNLASYRGLDRLGRAYEAPIPPDETAATRWESLGTPDDPGVAAALDWLSTR